MKQVYNPEGSVMQLATGMLAVLIGIFLFVTQLNPSVANFLIKAGLIYEAAAILRLIMLSIREVKTKRI